MSSTSSWPTKTTTEHLDYFVDWTARMKDDRITDSSFSLGANSGIQITNSSFTNTVTTVWLDGGVDGKTEEVHNVVTTFNGRVMEVIISIQIRDY